MAKKQNHLLILRGDIWYYQRRVPKKFRHVESRPIIRSSLNTDSLVLARRRRDALVEADDLYWAALAQEALENGGVSEATREVQSQRYKAASLRALGYGFAYKTANQLIQEASADQLMDRIEAATAKAAEQSTPSTEVTDALLGGVEKPQADQRTVTECFRFYVDEIEFDAQINKSPGQRRSWENSKRVGIDYFVEAVGDIPMRDITRDHGIAYRNWWANRIKVGDENGYPSLNSTVSITYSYSPMVRIISTELRIFGTRLSAICVNSMAFRRIILNVLKEYEWRFYNSDPKRQLSQLRNWLETI